jgi:signal transduction histidine kinase
LDYGVFHPPTPVEESNGFAEKNRSTTPVIALLASDLRNFLAVMAKSLESIRTRLGPNNCFERDLAELDGAIDGAYDLCRELIAFSESRGLEPGVVDVSELVSESRSMLERMLGPNIILSFNLTATLSNVAASVVPLQCVLLSLAANARDAMPDGGTLTIETRSIEVNEDQRAGSKRSQRYVRLTVSDTGGGMSAEVQTRALEPFFTTRQDRTGLGLTSVMMTVRRLGGFVQLESCPGSGTRVHLYLPLLNPLQR